MGFLVTWNRAWGMGDRVLSIGFRVSVRIWGFGYHSGVHGRREERERHVRHPHGFLQLQALDLP